jgi:hypothetical protein
MASPHPRYLLAGSAPQGNRMSQYLRFRGAIYQKTSPLAIVAKDMGSLVDPEQFKQLITQIHQAASRVTQHWGPAQKQYQQLNKFRQESLAQMTAYQQDPGKLQTDQKAIADQTKPAAVQAFDQQGKQEVDELYGSAVKYYPNVLKQLNKLVGGSEQDQVDAQAAQQQFGQKLQQDLGKFQSLEKLTKGATVLNQQLTGVVNHLNSYQSRKEPDRQAVYQAYVKQFGGQEPIASITALANGLGVLNQALPKLMQLYNGAVDKIKQKYQKHQQKGQPATPAPTTPKFDPSKRVQPAAG